MTAETDTSGRAVNGPLFYDSSQPDKIPASAARVALYATDCDYPAIETDPDLAKRWTDPAQVRWITFSGLRRCSIADYEPGTEVYHDGSRLRTWAAVRRAKGLGRSIVYSDLSDVWKAQNALQGEPASWWLATEGEGWLSALELSRLLADLYSVTLHPAAIWAQQDIVPGLPYDQSQLFGAWR